MAMICDNCKKGIMHGHNVSHSKRRTNRIFKPNLQYTRVMVLGKSVRMRLCTKCIKLYKKNEKESQRIKEEASQAAIV
ncbi:50S ribosomal protein L28 [Patescibacteria group bacterium]|nr:50S ribosomal protein L28 [Patescibacteria group bacterium]